MHPIFRTGGAIFHTGGGISLAPLTLTIEPTVEGTCIVGNLSRRLQPWTLTISWSPNNARFYATEVSRSDERPKMRTTVKDYGAAYRAACRAIEKIASDPIQVALRRAVTPIPLRRLEVLGVYIDDPEGDAEMANWARAVYRWRFAGNMGPNWDVDVDERYKNRYRGIACYLDSLTD